MRKQLRLKHNHRKRPAIQRKANGKAVLSRRRIRQIRFACGISQAVFAARIGVNVITVSRWERGYQAPKGLYLDKLLSVQKSLERKARVITNAPHGEGEVPAPGGTQ